MKFVEEVPAAAADDRNEEGKQEFLFYAIIGNHKEDPVQFSKVFGSIFSEGRTLFGENTRRSFDPTGNRFAR